MTKPKKTDKSRGGKTNRKVNRDPQLELYVTYGDGALAHPCKTVTEAVNLAMWFKAQGYGRVRIIRPVVTTLTHYLQKGELL